MDQETAAGVRLLVADVDGVMTDGSIYIDDLGHETKRFHVRDGCGIRIWKRLGLEFGIITGRRGMAVQHRASELGISRLIQGASNKADALVSLCNELQVDPNEVAVIGDDLPDLPMLELAGYPMAVSDASREVRDRAVFVTVRPGGLGAVREAVEHLLKASDRWDDALALFGNHI